MAEDKIVTQIVQFDKPFMLYGTDQANFGRYGYYIAGWRKSPNGTEEPYAALSNVLYADIANSPEDERTDLYAVWSRNSYDVRIVNCPRECDIPTTGSGSYVYEAPATIQARESQPEDDYAFIQWNFPDGSASYDSTVTFSVLSSIDLSAMFKDLRTIWMKSNMATEKTWRYKDLPSEVNGKLVYMYSGECVQPFSEDYYLSAANALYQLSVYEENLTSVGEGSFKNCQNLMSAEIPLIKVIGSEAFSGCSNLEYIDMKAVLSIEASAFNGCSMISSIDTPNVKYISDGAFQSCSSLTAVSLPELTCIGTRVFAMEDKPWLATVEIVDCPKIELVGEKAFCECSALTYVLGVKNAISVGAGAFQQCSSLTSMNLLSAKDVCASAFSDCAQLTSVFMPCVSAIGKNVFQNCMKLKKLDFGYTISASEIVVDDINGLFKGIFDRYPANNIPASAMISCYVPYDYDAYLTWLYSDWSYQLSNYMYIIRHDNN